MEIRGRLTITRHADAGKVGGEEEEGGLWREAGVVVVLLW